MKIGPYSIIGKNVQLGDDCYIGNNVTITGNTAIGKKCKIFHSSSIGEIPQDLKFDGEKTKTIIGDNTTIREFVTINKGTNQLGKTELGSNVLLMASTHIAHDCIVGDNVILSNLATLGGHVEIGDWAVLGGGVLVHQFCQIGEHAFVGASGLAVQDVPPYILAAGSPLVYSGINSIGLKRRGFSSEDRKEIKGIYKEYFLSNDNRKNNLEKISSNFVDSEFKNNIIKFIESSERGII